MRTLIVSDLHLRIGILDIVLSRQHLFDRIIFLGNYFTGYSDDPNIYSLVAETLKLMGDNEKFVFLVGKDDFQYLGNGDISASPNPPVFEKLSEITKHKLDADRFGLVYRDEDGITFSNAGLSCNAVQLFPGLDGSKSDIERFNFVVDSIANYNVGLHFGNLDKKALPCHRSIWSHGYPKTSQKNDNGIMNNVMDPSFTHTKGICQIFGHTTSPVPVICFLSGFLNNITQDFSVFRPKESYGFSLCMNTGNQHMCVLESGKVSVMRTSLFGQKYAIGK